MAAAKKEIEPLEKELKVLVDGLAAFAQARRPSYWLTQRKKA